MTSVTKEQITTRLFVGCVLSPDIRMALNQSPAWKQAQIGESDTLKEQPYRSKKYLGFFLDEGLITLHKIHEAESKIRSQLRRYCPTIPSDNLPVFVLSIMLVS